MVAPVLRGRVRLGAKHPGGMPACRIYGDAQDVVDSFELVPVALDTLYGADPYGFADLDNSRLVIPSGLGGRYLLTARSTILLNAQEIDTYTAFLQVLVNNDLALDHWVSPEYNREYLTIVSWTLQLADQIDLDQGDAVSMAVLGLHPVGLNYSSLSLLKIA